MQKTVSILPQSCDIKHVHFRIRHLTAILKRICHFAIIVGVVDVQPNERTLTLHNKRTHFVIKTFFNVLCYQGQGCQFLDDD